MPPHREAVIPGDGDRDRAHTDVVRLLVEEGGADVRIADNDGLTALQHARSHGYDAIAEILERATARRTGTVRVCAA